MAGWRCGELVLDLAHSSLDLKEIKPNARVRLVGAFISCYVVISLSVNNWAVWVLALNCSAHRTRGCAKSLLPGCNVCIFLYSSHCPSFRIDYVAGSRMRGRREIFIAQFSAWRILVFLRIVYFKAKREWLYHWTFPVCCNQNILTCTCRLSIAVVFKSVCQSCVGPLFYLTTVGCQVLSAPLSY